MAQKQKKHTKTIVIAVIVMLIPLAILGLIVYQNLQEGLFSGKVLKVEVTYSDKKTQTEEEEAGIAPYLEAIRSGNETVLAASDVKSPLEEYEKVDLVFSKLSETYSFSLYLSPVATDCLYADRDGAIHLIRQPQAEALLALPGIYARVMPYVSAPEFHLVLSDGTEILPRETSGLWVHVKENGVREEETIDLTADLLPTSLPAGTAFTFKTPLEPDYVSVRVLSGEELIYSGAPEKLPVIARTAEEDLTVFLECEWYENKTRAYQGSLEFKFLLFYDKETVHSLSASEARPGDTLTLTVENTQSDPVSVTCTFAAGEIRQVRDGFSYTFFIPVLDNAAGEYAVLVLGSDLNLNLPVTILPPS